jgi:acyl-CoA reductase-like NAD-dependent aldehyde dehydrogenase
MPTKEVLLTSDQPTTEPGRIRNFISGQWSDGVIVQEVREPYSGTRSFDVVDGSADDCEAAVRAAVAAWTDWRRVPAFERAGYIAGAAALLADEAEQCAMEMTAGLGKTIRDARAEVSRAVSTLRVSAEEAGRICAGAGPSDLEPAGRDRFGVGIRVPVGVVAAITPFNAPMNLLCHKIGPALAAGNCAVVKPHPRGAAVTAHVIDAFHRAGLPPGVLGLLNGGPDAGRRLACHDSISLVNFTGSTAAGEELLRLIGLKRSVLELGGNAPTIVHSDADLTAAVTGCVAGSFALSGQSCVSTQRILVAAEVHDRFLDEFVSATARLNVGNPVDPATDVGPVVDEAAATRLISWVTEAAKLGASVLCGGERHGALVQPTVLSQVPPAARAYCEEVFGPIVSVVPYQDLDQAITLANDSRFGLRAGVFTSAINVATRLASDLAFGSVNVNAPSRFRVDHEPSGGVKASGWGREGPRHAILDMTDLKWISLPW